MDLNSFTRRFLFAISFLLVVSTGCSTLENNPASQQPTPTETLPEENREEIKTPVPTSTQKAVSEAAPSKTITPPVKTPSPAIVEFTPTADSSPQAANPDEIDDSSPLDLALNQESILFYPIPAIYDGDLVSIQVKPTIPRGIAPNDVDVQILLDGSEIVSSNLNWRGLDGDSFGLYRWVWNANNQSGSHVVTITLDPRDDIKIGDENPDNNTLTTVLVVEPRNILPRTEANAIWTQLDNNCCTLHAISGTAAHRDLDQLAEMVDEAFLKASEKLEEPLTRRYHVYFADRVIGQGGYANATTVISYLDRDYVGGGLEELLIHEAVHLIDSQFAPNRIKFWSEGVAVWTAGGHYWQQDLDQRMAALVELGHYLPIAQAIDDFYSSQHEIGYLEAASLISYLVKTYSWPIVKNFYSDASSTDARSLSRAVDLNMGKHFNKSLEEIESDWLTYLDQLPRDLSEVSNLHTSLRYFDVMRQYQSQYDSSAFYRTAWLVTPEEAELRGTTAELSRRPESDLNIALETMLIAANKELQNEAYDRTNAILDSIVRVMNNGGRFLDPLANSYLEIVQVAGEGGYEVQQIDLDGDRATVQATRLNQSRLRQLQLFLKAGQNWALAG